MNSTKEQNHNEKNPMKVNWQKDLQDIWYNRDFYRVNPWKLPFISRFFCKIGMHDYELLKADCTHSVKLQCFVCLHEKGSSFNCECNKKEMEMENLKEKPSVPQPGSRWKHFKGTVYTVDAISRDCENPNRFLVVYSDSDQNVWVRELSDFLGTHESGVKRFIPVESLPWKDSVTLMEGPIKLDRQVMDKVCDILSKKEVWLPFGQAFPDYANEALGIVEDLKRFPAIPETIEQIKTRVENLLIKKGKTGRIKVTLYFDEAFIWYQPPKTE